MNGPLPRMHDHRPQVWHFQAGRRVGTRQQARVGLPGSLFPSAECPLQCAETTSGEEAASMQQQHRPRNSASAKQGACLARCLRPGSGSQSVDRGLRLHPAAGRSGRLAAGRDPAHAVLRTAVPQWRHRLRPGADGVCRHRDGDRQPRRQPRLSSDDDGRPDHAFHARGDRPPTCWPMPAWSGSGAP